MVVGGDTAVRCDAGELKLRLCRQHLVQEPFRMDSNGNFTYQHGFDHNNCGKPSNNCEYVT